jgi:hypothetical protein
MIMKCQIIKEMSNNSTKYRHWLKYSRWLNYRHWQNIGVDKILASAKYWCRQNLGVDKISALTKYRRWQNIGVNKISASTKYCRRQNIGVDKIMYKSGVKASPYWFCLAKSTVADSSLVLPPLHVVAEWRGRTAAWLIWAHSALYCPGWLYRSAMLEILKISASQKYWRPPIFHYFSPNFGGQYLHS